MTAAKIALVDDDPQFVAYLDTLLTSKGYDVLSFTSGSNLLQTLHSEAPPDVVLLDVSMPDMDGLETLKAIRAAHPGVPVIMLSGRQTPNTIVDAMRQGALDYVVKPHDPDGFGEAALESTIRNAIEKRVLNTEIARLRTEVGEHPEGTTFWGPSSAMRQVMAMVDRVADSDISVLLRGESGVGKEVIARELHRRSSRRHKPFVKVNAAALPSELLESELFGHERGAFTGAQATRAGKFEYADHGTLMLDEIGEMPAGLQAKLLHVLQDGEFTKIGSNKPIHVDVRIIAATNRDLEAMMRAGAFREDLYYRLQVIELFVPPLRERREEIPQLIAFFLVKYSERYGRPHRPLSDALRDTLLSYSWPGNVRELENVIKRYVILQDERLVMSELTRVRTGAEAGSSVLSPAAPSVPASQPAEQASPPRFEPSQTTFVSGPALPPVSRAPADKGDAGAKAASTGPVRLPELAREAAMRAERAAIQDALDRFRWNRRKAATHLGVSYKTLLNKIRECGISEQQI